MPKIKAINAIPTETGSLIVVDDKGRIWIKIAVTSQWSLEELPEDPEPDAPKVS